MIKVFIVDDHEIFREGLKKILGTEPGMEIVGEADNGNEVVKGVLESGCDLLLLDLNIPGLEGVDLIREVKKAKPSVQILILSIHPEDKFVLPLLRAGASGYISKKSELSELIHAIQKVHAKGRYISKSLTENLSLYVAEDALTPLILSNFEIKLINLISTGKDLLEIAEEVGKSVHSVIITRRKILAKLKLKNNVQLTYYAIQNNVLDD